MLFLDISDYEKAFERNIEDWCLGGPKKDGWTREGKEIFLNKKLLLKSFSHDFIDLEYCLEKNYKEVKKWHIDFLYNKKNIKDTKYYEEYLFPRYNNKSIYVANKFLNLFEKIKIKGFNIKYPIFLADVSSLNLGFKYFRFDGCHRVACCKVLGHSKIYSVVFKVIEK
jgi:hypothetical protein